MVWQSQRVPQPRLLTHVHMLAALLTRVPMLTALLSFAFAHCPPHACVLDALPPSPSAQDSSAGVPIFVFLSPGVDVAGSVEALGRKLGYTADAGAHPCPLRLSAHEALKTAHTRALPIMNLRLLRAFCPAHAPHLTARPALDSICKPATSSAFARPCAGGHICSSVPLPCW